MITQHSVRCGDARQLAGIADNSVHVVVTSPPYPLVEMWDDVFGGWGADIADALAEGHGPRAFAAMHDGLDPVWRECFRVLVPGGFLCVNIGDATRTMGGEFGIYPNHARILHALMSMGFTILPDILWRKPTNAPNKFMGSGMLPAGAYVTYEHEYILIARKGGRRVFRREADKQQRRESAYFWEERNRWFSDVWSDVTGTRQAVEKAVRPRSAAFPIELPYRLIQMFSVYGDVVLDPFAGTGTTLIAAVAAGRSSIGVDIEPSFVATATDMLSYGLSEGTARAAARWSSHLAFVQERVQSGKTVQHQNAPHGFPVMTRQERDLVLRAPTHIEACADGTFAVKLDIAQSPAPRH